MSKAIKIGSILHDSSTGKFAKVIDVYHGVYGLSGWSTRKVVEKATVATIRLNGRALARSEFVKAVSNASGKVAPAKPDAAPKDPAAPKEPKAPKAAKSTIAKPAVKKAAKKAQAAAGKGKTTRKSK